MCRILTLCSPSQAPPPVAGDVEHYCMPTVARSRQHMEITQYENRGKNNDRRLMVRSKKHAGNTWPCASKREQHVWIHKLGIAGIFPNHGTESCLASVLGLPSMLKESGQLLVILGQLGQMTQSRSRWCGVNWTPGSAGELQSYTWHVLVFELVSCAYQVVHTFDCWAITLVTLIFVFEPSPTFSPVFCFWTTLNSALGLLLTVHSGIIPHELREP